MKKIIFPVLLIFLLLSAFRGMAQPIQLRIPALTSTVGNAVDVPVYVDNSVTGLNVFAYQFKITYNSNYINYSSIEIVGTMVQSWGSPMVNSTTPGTLILAGAGTSPLIGTGVLFYIRFQCISAGTSSLNFNGGAASNFFNEGTPVMTFVNGSLVVNALPTITVSPNTALLSVGETQQFTVSGGTAPYTWGITNPAVASISTSGLLTATAAGFTQVSATDNNGITDLTNGDIEIRAMKLTFPTTSALQGTIVEIPVNVTNLSGLGCVSGNFTVTFNQNILTATGYNTTGTLLSGYPNITINNAIGGTVQIAFAGTIPLSGSGILINLQFQVSSVNTGTSALNFTSAQFNETMLAKTVNGSFTTINLPAITISPNTFTMVAGETKQFTASGGTAPYSWKSSDNLLATVNATGLLTANRGGIVMLTATDNNGASGTGGNITIYDTYVSVLSSGVVPGSVIDLPIAMSSLPAGKSVYSVEGTISYKSPELAALDIISTGTMTSGWTFSKNVSGNKITFAGAGTTNFSGPGTMFYIRFQTTANLTLGEVAYVNIDNILLNEGDPSARIQNGAITGSSPATESLTLSAGWSGISAYLSPSDPNIVNMFAPVQSNLLMLYNSTTTYSPPLGILPVNPWNASSGYFIKMSAPQTFVVSGIQNTNKTLNLSAGWNLIPVISSTPVNCAGLLSGVNFVIIKEAVGIKMYWPASAIQTLTTLQPGNSYLIYMNSAGNLVFP